MFLLFKLYIFKREQTIALVTSLILMINEHCH